MTVDRLEVRACAKVNLDLRLRGMRADGYHNVQTVLQSVALADDVTCERIDGPFVLECDARGVPTDERNLAWRAAAATWQALGRSGAPHGLRVRLLKRIPTQAGLGGGSADAAAVVWAAQRIWGEHLSAAAEHRVLAALGADVPFFRRGGTMMGVGRGDELFDLPDLPRYLAVVAVPAQGVSTPQAYRWFDEQHAEGVGAEPAEWPATSTAWPSFLPSCVNDFEVVVAERVPEIRRCLDALQSGGAVLARLSGSGSAVFGLFDTLERSSVAAQALRRAGVATVIETTTLSAAEATFEPGVEQGAKDRRFRHGQKRPHGVLELPGQAGLE